MPHSKQQQIHQHLIKNKYAKYYREVLQGDVTLEVKAVVSPHVETHQKLIQQKAKRLHFTAPVVQHVGKVTSIRHETHQRLIQSKLQRYRHIDMARPAVQHPVGRSQRVGERSSETVFQEVLERIGDLVNNQKTAPSSLSE